MSNEQVIARLQQLRKDHELTHLEREAIAWAIAKLLMLSR